METEAEMRKEESTSTAMPHAHESTSNDAHRDQGEKECSAEGVSAEGSRDTQRTHAEDAEKYKKKLKGWGKRT